MPDPLRVAIYASDKAAPSWQRAVLPGHWMHKMGLAEVKFEQGENDAIFEWAEVALYQRWYDERSYAWFRALMNRGIPIVYELDDDIWAIEASNPFKARYTPAMFDAVKGMVGEAALVTTTCEHLATTLRAYNPNVVVIPTGVDPGVFDMEPPRPHPGEVRIGFGGSLTHDQDLTSALEAVAEIMRRHRHVHLRVIGPVPVSLPRAMAEHRVYGGRVQASGWVPFAGDPERKLPALYEVYRQADVDIAVVPLRDTKFNRGKSHIKYCEFGAFGACVVAANVGIYADVIVDGENGRLVAGNFSGAWRRTLMELLVDMEATSQMGAAAKADVRKRFSFDVLAHQWAAALGSVIPGRNA
jgi:glycosyltransferase involved in cell wall biosynthesis